MTRGMAGMGMRGLGLCWTGCRMLWLSRGFRLDLNRTCILRAAASFSWFKASMAVFERVAPCDLACSTRRCVDNGFTGEAWGEEIPQAGPEKRSREDRVIADRLCSH